MKPHATLIHNFVMLACFVVMAISGSNIVGYATENKPFFQLSDVPMAFDTALCLFVLASAVAIRSVYSYKKL